MKKIICKVEYDTENSEFLGKITSGYVGDSEGYEECLFRTADGKYFLYCNGGENSKYKKEDIKRMSKEKANEWLQNNA